MQWLGIPGIRSQVLFHKVGRVLTSFSLDSLQVELQNLVIYCFILFLTTTRARAEKQSVVSSKVSCCLWAYCISGQKHTRFCLLFVLGLIFFVFLVCCPFIFVSI